MHASAFRHWTLLLLVLLVFGAAAPAVAQRGAPRLVVDLPMEFRGTSPAVRVMVNGKGPYLFLIDTGGQGQARADTSLVKELGLASTGSAVSGDGSGINSRVLDRVTLDRVGVGSLTFRNVVALSRDYNRTPNIARIAGILGFNLFDDHLLTLDFIGRRVRIERGALPPADGKTIIDYEAPYDTPIIEVAMGGLRLLADIDSGDTGAISFPKALTTILPRMSEPRVVGRGRTISNDFEIMEVQMRGMLRLGEHEISNPSVAFNDVHDNINLGANFLKDFTVTFDHRNRRVRFIRRPE